MATTSPDLITLKGLSERLQLSPKTLRKMGRRDGLPLWRLTDGGPMFAFWTEVEAWLKKRRKAPA